MPVKPSHAQLLAAAKAVDLLRRSAEAIVEAMRSPIIRAFFESKKDVLESMILGEVMIRVTEGDDQLKIATNNVNAYTRMATDFWKFINASPLPSDEEMGRLIADYADVREAFSLAAEDILSLEV